MRRSETSGTNRTDESIDSLLAGIRNAEPPAGMGRRILQTLQQRVSTETARTGPKWSGLARPVLWSAASSLVVAVLITLAVRFPALHRRAADPTPKSATQAAVITSPKATGIPEEADGLEQDGTRANAANWLNASHGPARATAVRALPPQDAEDAIALAEMRAPSHPAPPMPLTEQERLLQHVAQSGDPQQMAALDPGVRAKQEIEAKAEVEAFFRPPPLPAEENE